MTTRYFRVVIAVTVILGIALLAEGQVAWAGQNNNNVDPVAAMKQIEPAILQAKSKPGSVQPPPPEFYVCVDGVYPVGGVVILEIKDLKPSYCVEAVLWNPRFQVEQIPEDAGSPLANVLFLRIYYVGRVTYELPMEDGSIEACYAIPPEKQVQFYFYDFYGMHFKKLTQPPTSWEQLGTRVDTEKKTACAFTQISGVYSLVGK